MRLECGRIRNIIVEEIASENINPLAIDFRRHVRCTWNVAVPTTEASVTSSASEHMKRYQTMYSTSSVYKKNNAQTDAITAFLDSLDSVPGTKYKFRSECRRDAELFFATLEEFTASRSLTSLNFAELEGEFVLATQLSPQDLLWAACQVPDGHVLVQTLEVERNYTGERDYDRYLDENSQITPCSAVREKMRRGAKAYVESLKFFLQDAKDFAASM